MNKMKERGRRKAALADRKSAAAQARMKNIASLAADDRVPKKKRKAGAGAFHQAVKKRKEKKLTRTTLFKRTRSALTTKTGPYIAKS